MLTPLEILRQAKDLIMDPKCWCQGQPARDLFDVPCNAFDPNAAKFCALGALVKVSAVDQCWDNYTIALSFIKHAAKEHFKIKDDYGLNDVLQINDRLGHDDVLKLFDFAIEEAELEAKESIP